MKKKEIYARHLSEMIQCRTVSREDDSHTADVLRFHALLEKLYPLVHRKLEKRVIAGASLLFYWKGQSQNSGDSIVLMGHLDTVGANESDWTHKPFSGAIEKGERGLAGGRVWGRGTLDCKGSVCAILEAVESLLEDAFVPQTDVYLSFGHNEEVYGSGAVEIVDYFQKNNIRPALVLDEGGAIVSNVLPGLKKPCAMIGVTEKGVANFRFTARSAGGHASIPPIRSPIGRLSLFAAGIEKKYPFKAVLTRPVIEMFTKLGPEAGDPLRFIFSHAGFFSPLLTAVLRKRGGEARAMVTSTCAFTMMSGSDKPNVLPVKAEMIANIRIGVNETVSGVQKALEKRAAPFGIEVDRISGQEPSPVSDTSSPVYKMLEKQVTASFPGVKAAPYVMLGCSDSRHYTKVCDQVFRFSPFDLSAGQMASVHGADEYIHIDSLSRGVHFYRDLVYNTLPGTH